MVVPKVDHHGHLIPGWYKGEIEPVRQVSVQICDSLINNHKNISYICSKE